MSVLKPLLFSVVLCAIFVVEVSARQTIVTVGDVVRPVTFGAFDAGDFDGDGADDLFVTGDLNNGDPKSALYRFVQRQVVQVPNAGPIITARYELVQFPIKDVSRGSVAWEDMNGDGDLDVIVSGRWLEDVTTNQREFNVATDIYYNESGSSFTIDEATGLPAVMNSQTVPADFNSDGHMDVVIGGERIDGSFVFGVYLNDGAGSFQESPTSLPGMRPTTISVGDIDSDGDIDFIAGGLLSNGRPVVNVYENNGDASFQERPDAFPDLYFPTTALGDLDGDGDDDLLLTGGLLGPELIRGQSTLYLNEGGTFVEQDLEIPGLFKGRAGFGDMDGDTDIDFFVEGISDLSSEEGQKIVAYENIDGFLLQVINARSVLFGDVDWMDYDGDGRLDVLLMGLQGDTRTVLFYEL